MLNSRVYWSMTKNYCNMEKLFYTMLLAVVLQSWNCIGCLRHHAWKVCVVWQPGTAASVCYVVCWTLCFAQWEDDILLFGWRRVCMLTVCKQVSLYILNGDWLSMICFQNIPWPDACLGCIWCWHAQSYSHQGIFTFQEQICAWF